MLVHTSTDLQNGTAEPGGKGRGYVRLGRLRGSGTNAIRANFFSSSLVQRLILDLKPVPGTRARTRSGSPAPYSCSSPCAPRVDASPFQSELRWVVSPRVGRLALKVDTIPGKMRATRGLRVGRQAQIIPVLHSMADHEAAPTLSSLCGISLVLECGRIERNDTYRWDRTIRRFFSD